MSCNVFFCFYVCTCGGYVRYISKTRLPGLMYALPLCSAAQSCAAQRRRAASAARAAGGEAQAPPPRFEAVIGGDDFLMSQKNGVEDQLFKGDVLGASSSAVR